MELKKDFKDLTIEELRKHIIILEGRNLLEEITEIPANDSDGSDIKVKSSVKYYRITIQGSKLLDDYSVIPVTELKEEMYQRYGMLSDDLQNIKKDIEIDAQRINEKIEKHDRQIDTLFTRIIEIFGVFVAIFSAITIGTNFAYGSLPTDSLEAFIRVMAILVIPLITLFVFLFLFIRIFVIRAPGTPLNSLFNKKQFYSSTYKESKKPFSESELLNKVIREYDLRPLVIKNGLMDSGADWVGTDNTGNIFVIEIKNNIAGLEALQQVKNSALAVGKERNKKVVTIIVAKQFTQALRNTAAHSTNLRLKTIDSLFAD